MKIKEWIKMLEKLDQEKELCIAVPSSDFKCIKIKYEFPVITQYNNIDKSWHLYETNKITDEKDSDVCDYVIY